jgi:phosphoribosylformylglycinamidine cyclo-ligase
VDNIPRVLPKSLDVVIKKGSWDMLPIFKIIEKKAACRTTSFTRFSTWASAWSQLFAEKANDVLKFIRAQKHKAWLIGEVVKGKGVARVE